MLLATCLFVAVLYAPRRLGRGGGGLPPAGGAMTGPLPSLPQGATVSRTSSSGVELLTASAGSTAAPLAEVVTKAVEEASPS